MFVVLGAAGCLHSRPPPRIGLHLPASFAEAKPAFDARVRERFPVGSSESALLKELEDEGFGISAAEPVPTQSRIAAYEAEGIPCKLVWKIIWAAQAGEITAVSGDFYGICL